ncbi:MAG: HD domain-containing protein [Burkholderiales bacterium]|jgi:hypothetical protein
MEARRNNFDVTNSIDTTDVASVSKEVRRIFRELYPDTSSEVLDRSFTNVGLLFRGEYVGYRACDTEYHNLQHTLDVALAMVRLMDGYERANRRPEPIGPRLFVFGTVTALLHDIGYLRRNKDTRHQNGAEYTLTHVTRGGKFIEDYLNMIGMNDLAPAASEIVHFTGFERPLDQIKTPSEIFRLLGNMLGTADIIAQMSDRCYLEKCRDRLFQEFVACGLAESEMNKALGDALFSSPEDLVFKTPDYYRSAKHRLNELLGGVYSYAQKHFGNQNLYLDEIDKNVQYAASVAEERDVSLLRRTPPEPLADEDSGDEHKHDVNPA